MRLLISISSEEKKERFLTAQHEFDILKRKNDVCPHIIAVDKNVLIGDKLRMHPKFGEEIEMLKAMIAKIENIKMPFKTYVIMGQVYDAKADKQQGVFRKLYPKMKETTSQEFYIIVMKKMLPISHHLKRAALLGFNILFVI